MYILISGALLNPEMSLKKKKRERERERERVVDLKPDT